MNCKNCQNSFEIAPEDEFFYDKISPVVKGKKYPMPEPTLCPDCRRQRRLTYRNERHLYQRKCDLCKKDIISIFDKNTPYTVYCIDCWWSDKWDPFKYGRDFDFNKSFFEQFKELMMEVPKAGMLQFQNENSDYNSLLAYSKNTYMSPGSYFMEDCYYCHKSQYSKDCYDSMFLDHCELVSQSVNCAKCYSSHHLINCRNCSDCAYMADSQSCKNCFMCAGLNNKKYHYKNKPYSKEEYEKIIEEQRSKNPKELQQEFLEFSRTIPKKYQNQLNCENSSGDYIQNCKNAKECYDSFDIEDSKYLSSTVNVKDSMDICDHDKDIQLCYELITGGESNTLLKFSVCAIACPNSEYLYSCFHLSDSFACDGIREHTSHCILNKKYSPEEYESLKEKIIRYMMETKEYGEFFPIEMSPHGYNETPAQDFYPLTKEEAQQKGYAWKDDDPKQHQPTRTKVPKFIQETTATITKELLACEKCHRNYRIISQELDFCKKMNLPLSPLCPDCRFLDLLSMKNPRKLWDRTCAKCQSVIQTTYAPDRPGAPLSGVTIYCEKCYLETVY